MNRMEEEESSHPSFVLELQPVRQLSAVRRVLDILSDHFEKEGYGFADSSEGEGRELFRSGRGAWLSWLVRGLTYWSMKEEEEEGGDGKVSEVVERLAAVIAIFSGRAASGGRVVKFKLLGEVELALYEPSYVEADLGWQTWPAGWLLSSLIRKYPPYPSPLAVELGCGTGIVGLASLKVNPTTPVYFTDYHPNVLTNINKTIQLNHLPLTTTYRTLKLDWDWFEPDTIHWDTSTDLKVWEPFKGTCHTIYAADILYQLRHAHSVPRVLSTLLTTTATLPDPALPLSDFLTNHPTPRALILIPIRTSHLADTYAFELALTTSQLTTLYTQTYLPPASTPTSSDPIASIPALLHRANTNPLPTDLDTLVRSLSSTPSTGPIIAYKLYVIVKYHSSSSSIDRP